MNKTFVALHELKFIHLSLSRRSATTFSSTLSAREWMRSEKKVWRESHVTEVKLNMFFSACHSFTSFFLCSFILDVYRWNSNANHRAVGQSERVDFTNELTSCVNFIAVLLHFRAIMMFALLFCNLCEAAILTLFAFGSSPLITCTHWPIPYDEIFHQKYFFIHLIDFN